MYKYLLFLMISCRILANSDSLFVKGIENGDRRNTYVVLWVQSNKIASRLTTVTYVESMLYKKYYKSQYKTLYDFLYDIVINKKPVPVRFVKNVVFDPLRFTRISREAKNGETYVLDKYLIRNNITYLLKKELKEIEKNDLIRVMFNYKYMVMIACVNGELIFYKAD